MVTCKTMQMIKIGHDLGEIIGQGSPSNSKVLNRMCISVPHSTIPIQEWTWKPIWLRESRLCLGQIYMSRKTVRNYKQGPGINALIDVASGMVISNCHKRSFRTRHRSHADIAWHPSQFSSSPLENHTVTSHCVCKKSCQSTEQPLVAVWVI